MSRATGLAIALGLMVAAYAVPDLAGWDIHLKEVPPLHADWHPRLGPGSLPALAIAVVAGVGAIRWSEKIPWGWLLVTVFVVGLAWSLSLACVDGRDGIAALLDQRNEYLRTARATTDVHATLQGYVDRIPLSAQPHWPVHVAGHPPGALLFFVLLVKIGLGSGFAAGLAVAVIAATTPVAVLVTLRLLGAEDAARRAAPFLALGPAAVWQAVSADAMFTAVAAWGIATLTMGAVRRSIVWSAVAGLLLGYCVFLSYGLPLIGVVAVAVLYLARTWKPLPIAFVSALAVAVGFAMLGFNWLEALPVLRERYWDGVAHLRPTSYFLWANLAALLFATGPLVAPALTQLSRQTRTVSVLAASGLVMVLFADVSLMSKGEVERIWLPFVPWLLVSVALLPARWRRFGLISHVALALAIQHLLFTNW